MTNKNYMSNLGKDTGRIVSVTVMQHSQYAQVSVLQWLWKEDASSIPDIAK